MLLKVTNMAKVMICSQVHQPLKKNRQGRLKVQVITTNPVKKCPISSTRVMLSQLIVLPSEPVKVKKSRQAYFLVLYNCLQAFGRSLWTLTRRGKTIQHNAINQHINGLYQWPISIQRNAIHEEVTGTST
jgi:hypothetical protein